MARPTSESVKEKLLIVFVLAALLMVGMIWAEGLSDQPPATPAYYRESFQIDESVYLTLTAEAVEYQLTLTATPPAALTPSPSPGE